MKTVTFFSTLMRLVKKEAEARKRGDVKALELAQQRHEAYRQHCLKADVMGIGRGVR